MVRPIRTQADKDLDDLLFAWGRWCEFGGEPTVNTASFQSKVMALEPGETITMGGGSGPSDPLGRDSVESMIEAAVMRLSEADIAAANVLRLQYQAGIRSLVKRGVIRSVSARMVEQMNQDARARTLGVSLRTYRRKLQTARVAVQDDLARGLR
ncbi:hypothetical protein [Pontibacterium sp.]|uniref:hypothetical protein n=1 Tax=Pontibacterium sp. TaxID=2036026 RepID=UPI00356438D8